MCDDVRGITEKLKEAVDKLVVQYSHLNHQLFGSPPPARYVPVLTFIRSEMKKTLEKIQDIDVEHVVIFKKRDAKRSKDDRWEIRKYNEELGEGRIIEHLESVFTTGQRCTTMLLVIERNMPKEDQLMVEGDVMKLDIDRGMWNQCRMHSKQGHEKAFETVHLIMSVLDELWEELGTMATSLTIVEDELKRNQTMREDRDH